MAKSKLVKDFKTLLQGQKLAEVNAAFEQAKREAFPEIFTSPLSDMVDSQMKTLKDRGCPKTLVNQLAGMKDMVITKGTQLWTARYPNLSLQELAEQGIYISIPVVPRSIFDLDHLMSMVVYKGKQGKNYLNQSKVNDLIRTPNRPYWMFDVEDGLAMCGKAPQDAESLVMKQKKTCTIVDEGIAVCTHTPVLAKHYVDCTGSRYELSGRVPVVCLLVSPVLGWYCADGAHDECGSVSCRARSA